jgi:hypothetical protein
MNDTMNGFNFKRPTLHKIIPKSPKKQIDKASPTKQTKIMNSEESTDSNSVRRPTPLFPDKKPHDAENIKPSSRFKEDD